MMDKKEIEKKVKEILSKKLNIPKEKIKLNSHLVDDLGMDSFQAVEISFELKEKFNIKISDEEFTNIKKVADILKMINQKIKKI